MTTVNLSDELVAEAKRYAAAHTRSTAKQIEHWAKIGKLIDQNRHEALTYQDIFERLLAEASA